MVTKDGKIKCDVCGKYIGYEDISSGAAKHKYVYNMEEYYESFCPKHSNES